MTIIAGVDEVGRGALFGPVVAGACILSTEAIGILTAKGVKDSKQLSSTKREQLAVEIKAISIDFAIGVASVKEIDKLNILQASLLAMKRAILRLKVTPDLCLIDGNQKIKDFTIPQQTIIGGDRESIIIASASIIAKVWRDDLIVKMANKYPEYDLIKNKGYGTKKHREAIAYYGRSAFHRQSFQCS